MSSSSVGTSSSCRVYGTKSSSELRNVPTITSKRIYIYIYIYVCVCVCVHSYCSVSASDVSTYIHLSLSLSLSLNIYVYICVCVCVQLTLALFSSLLGYCIFPLDIAAFLCLFTSNKIISTIIVLACFSWSCWSAFPFVGSSVPPSKRVLALYPVRNRLSLSLSHTHTHIHSHTHVLRLSLTIHAHALLIRDRSSTSTSTESLTPCVSIAFPLSPRSCSGLSHVPLGLMAHASALIASTNQHRSYIYIYMRVYLSACMSPNLLQSKSCNM